MQSFISEDLRCLEKWPVPPSVSVRWKEEVSGEQGLDEGPCSVPASCLCLCGPELGWRLIPEVCRTSQAFIVTALVTSGISFTC